jgi:hypothetical protein
VFADTIDAYVGAVAAALADPDPWHGFTVYVEAVCAMQAADRGFAEVLRAKATGRLRPDFASQDLVILLMANAGVIAATGAVAPGSGRRLVGYMIQAFAAPQPATLPPPPDPEALAQAMLGLACPGSSRVADAPHGADAATGAG